jgi:hypothetical protein
MSQLDTDLALIGDRLQVAWRSDARRGRRRARVALGSAAFGALLALTAAAIAAGVLPIDLTPTSAKPDQAALVPLRGIFGAPIVTPKGLIGRPKLLVRRAIVVAQMQGRQIGTLSVLVVPVAPRGACVDAARADGSSYLAACATFPMHATTVDGTHVVYYQGTAAYLGGPRSKRPPLELTLRSAPPGAVKVDVRERDGSQLPAVLSHGWLVFLNQHPSGPVALVRFYDKAGKRILSFYG